MGVFFGNCSSCFFFSFLSFFVWFGLVFCLVTMPSGPPLKLKTPRSRIGCYALLSQPGTPLVVSILNWSKSRVKKEIAFTLVFSGSSLQGKTSQIDLRFLFRKAFHHHPGTAPLCKALFSIPIPALSPESYFFYQYSFEWFLSYTILRIKFLAGTMVFHLWGKLDNRKKQW